MTKKLYAGDKICKCECGGQVRAVEDFGRLFSWCEKCTPVIMLSADEAAQQMDNGRNTGGKSYYRSAICGKKYRKTTRER